MLPAATRVARREREHLLGEQRLLGELADLALQCPGHLPAALLDGVLRGRPRMPVQRRAARW